MLYKMKAAGKFVGNAIEFTYTEQITIKNGIAICRTNVARDVLHLRGYDLIEELPITLKADEGIPANLYTTEMYLKPIKKETTVTNQQVIEKHGKPSAKRRKTKNGRKSNRKTLHKRRGNSKAKRNSRKR